jgi:predicted nuclease of predicted toxin-antitoxin system
VKLLLDENLSPRLVELLSDLYPGSAHVHSCGMASATDSEIWECAKANSLTIVSVDSDFEERTILFGSPPKIILLRTSHCASEEIERLMRAAHSTVSRFILEREETCLILRHRHRSS